MKVVVIGGGTATNSIVTGFSECEKVSFVMPVSDDGGSSGEITRFCKVFAVGDIRSRIVRLIPKEKEPLIRFFGYRLKDRKEWKEVLTGHHYVWSGINEEIKHLIMKFLLRFNQEILKKESIYPEMTPFRFRRGCLGNFFFVGGKLESGCFKKITSLLMRDICGINAKYEVWGCLKEDSIYKIGVTLADGKVIIGQNEISHPTVDGNEETEKDTSDLLLESAITDVFYVAEDMKEGIYQLEPRSIDITAQILSSIDQDTLHCIRECDVVVLSVGSFFTSVMAVCKVLEHELQKHTFAGKKILYLLNGASDRETNNLTEEELIKHVVNITGNDDPVVLKATNGFISATTVRETLEMMRTTVI